MDWNSAVYDLARIKSPNFGKGESLGLLNTANMRRQHEAIEEMATAMLAVVAGYHDDYDAIPIARQLAKLSTLLRVHFVYEDMTLYPAMIRLGDREAACLALKFHEEMGSLAMRFEDFARRWSGPMTIAAAFEEFRDEAAAIFAVLAARIERENDLLYPLADRITEPRAA